MMTLPEFLVRDEYGGIRLTGHRISLHQLLWYFNQGYSPEMLICQYPSLPLLLVYKVITFYLENLAETDQYLAQEEAQIEEQRKNGTKLDIEGLKEKFEQIKRERLTPLQAG